MEKGRFFYFLKRLHETFACTHLDRYIQLLANKYSHTHQNASWYLNLTKVCHMTIKDWGTEKYNHQNALTFTKKEPDIYESKIGLIQFTTIITISIGWTETKYYRGQRMLWILTVTIYTKCSDEWAVVNVFTLSDSFTAFGTWCFSRWHF